MTAAFWWYILAGFIVGFSLSTVWEWLYFRKRRMRITDRRIAELEQAMRTQARNAATVEVLPEPGVTWSATEYQSPGVLLENEEDDDGLSAGQKAALGLAAGTAVAAVADALAAPDEAQQAEAPATSAPDEPEGAGPSGELATAALAGAAVAALLSEDEAADDGAVGVSEPEQVATAEAAPVASETAVAAPAPRSEPPPVAVAEVRGVTARQGYIVSELSPGEFTALQATQKAREAARKAWEQARAVSDYLRNI